MARLIITIGIPASGKSSLVKRVGIKYVSTDEIRQEVFGNVNDQLHNTEVFGIYYDRILTLLNSNESVIADSTNVSSSTRKRLYALAKDAGADVEIWFFDISIDEALERNKKRLRVVPTDVIYRMYYNLEKGIHEVYDEVESLGCNFVTIISTKFINKKPRV